MFFDFLMARHRRIYIGLAIQYWISPQRVYKLAHGSHAKSEKERKVQHEMIALGLIHRRH